MTTCQRCGARLPSIRLFHSTCRECGAKHKAVRNQALSWISGIYGGLAFIVIPVSLFLPGPLWMKIIGFPMLFIAGGIILAVVTQQWKLEKEK